MTSLQGNDFPVKVIVYILQFLNLKDRCSASQTCNKWREAAAHDKLRQNEVVTISDNLAIDFLSTQSTSLPPPIFRAFHFRDVEINIVENVKMFWEKFGINVQSLRFENCEVSDTTLSTILQSCPRIETLHIDNCNTIFMSGNVLQNLAVKFKLLQLQDLGLTNTKYLSDIILHRFISIAPNLIKINLNGCQITNNYYSNNENYSSNFLSLKNLLLILPLGQIKEIGLGNNLINSNGLKNVCTSMKDSKLTSLSLPSSCGLVNGIEYIVETFFSTLQKLDLSSCSTLSTETLSNLPTLNSLTYLNVRGCKNLSNDTVKHLGILTKLQSIDVSNIDTLTGPAVLEGLRHMRDLRHVYMNHLPQLDVESLRALLLALPRLYTLELQGCQLPGMDSVLATLCERHVALTRLDLSYCNLVSDVGLTGQAHDITVNVPIPVFYAMNDKLGGNKISLASRAEREIVYEATFKRKVEDLVAPLRERLRQLGGRDQLLGISNLTGLKSLDLSHCPLVTDLSIEHAFRFNDLQRLYLRGNNQLSDCSVQRLSLSCPSLEEIDLQDCGLLTEQSTFHLSSLTRLKYLTISDGSKLRRDSLDQIRISAASIQRG